jgi:beta-mannanase
MSRFVQTPTLLPVGIAFSLIFAFSACSGSESGSPATTNTGGAQETGGNAGAGGTTANAGGSVGNGGSTDSGGSQAAGGSSEVGGSVATGGSKPAGGTSSTGGSAATGGSKPAGGTSSTGGSKPTGGASSTGGSAATGGSKPTGGASSTGGSAATGGSKPTGGTSSTGGSVATGGVATTGGSSSTSSCSAAPVSPNATQQAKNLLCYLYSQYGNHVLSGQQETNWNANPTDISWYTSNNMKYPAVLGSDFMYRDGKACNAVTPSTTRAIAYWNAGGIIMFRYHMGMPRSGLTCTADCYQGADCAEPTTKPNSTFFTNVVTSGTAENTSLNSKLDYMAVQIQAMQDANVPVLLALYHETQSNGWFWWAMTTSGAAFVNLWNYSFDYLTKTKGLKNIIWLMPFSGTPSSAFLPPKSNYDIAGPDTYDTNQPFTSLFSTAKGVIGSTVPIPLHETGLVPSPSQMFPSSAPWLLFAIWAGYQSDGTHNTTSNIQSVYADSHTVTRDEIPNLK